MTSHKSDFNFCRNDEKYDGIISFPFCESKLNDFMKKWSAKMVRDNSMNKSNTVKFNEKKERNGNSKNLTQFSCTVELTLLLYFTLHETQMFVISSRLL